MARQQKEMEREREREERDEKEEVSSKLITVVPKDESQGTDMRDVMDELVQVTEARLKALNLNEKEKGDESAKETETEDTKNEEVEDEEEAHSEAMETEEDMGVEEEEEKEELVETEAGVEVELDEEHEEVMHDEAELDHFEDKEVDEKEMDQCELTEAKDFEEVMDVNVEVNVEMSHGGDDVFASPLSASRDLFKSPKSPSHPEPPMNIDDKENSVAHSQTSNFLSPIRSPMTSFMNVTKRLFISEQNFSASTNTRRMLDDA